MTPSLFLILTAMMAQKYGDKTEITVFALWSIALAIACTGH